MLISKLLKKIKSIFKKNYMKQFYSIKGKNNKIIIVDDGIEHILNEDEIIEGLNIKICGDNNTIRIEYPIKITESNFSIDNSNCNIQIKNSTKINKLYIYAWCGDGQSVSIGKNTTIVGTIIYLNEKSSVFIGEDCMFSDDITIWPMDGHSIIDNTTREIINEAIEPVTIGNHVWVGHGSRITKNARIYDNSIVGGGTVACKDYKENNVIIAGNPGKIIKQNINWLRQNPYEFKNK